MPVVLTQTIQPQSTVVSSSAAWGQGGSNAFAQATMAAADVENTANTMNFWIAASFDGGNTWSRQAGGPWQGGSVDKSGNPDPPGEVWTPSATNPPTHVRVEMDLGQPLSVGASLTLS